MSDSHGPDHEIVVIGAGLGGIGMGIALRRAGFDEFVILERADDIGGTWRDNTYPGIAVDVPAQAYQFSFELNPDWSRAYARGDEVKAYIDRCADRYDIRRHVRLRSEVTARRWDEDAHCWRLTVDGAELTTRFVISAIGPFVDPKPVEIPGSDSFRGTVLRTVGWDHDVDLTGKRVAVIGTGASALQLIPEIADEVAALDVYQRTPIWVGPKIDPPTPGFVRALYRRVPQLQEAVRVVVTRAAEAAIVGAVLRGQHVMAAVEWAHRELWYRLQVPDAELRHRLTPDYRFGCKRPSVSNSYLRTFTRPHVELITDPIEEITATGVRTTAGLREADVLVLATGFRMAYDPEVFQRTPVRGRAGLDLAEHFAEKRLASYESISIPGLPNHFMIFGPYAWTGGTYHQLVETASSHIVRVLSAARDRGATAVEVDPGACERWTATMRSRLAAGLWHSGGCATARSYYFDHHGDTPYLRPTSAASAARAAAGFPLEDYLFDTTTRRSA